MKHIRTIALLSGFLVIGFVIYMVYATLSDQEPRYITDTVETGPVQQLVSVTGITENRTIAELGFPTSGTLTDVRVRVGDTVEAGAVLATLDARSLLADRQEALAGLARAQAERAELLAGVTDSTRAVSAETVRLKQNTLARTTLDQNRLVANARRTLLTSDLTAITDDDDEDATPPEISGTYTCDTEGEYMLEFFSSNSASGYSFKLSGLEEGTFVASAEQPVPFGSCGLRVLISPDDRYNRSIWIVSIPNTLGALYTQNRNTYDSAKLTAESQIALATQDLALAEANASNATAETRPELILRANASVAEAEARLARVESALSDRTLVAPFTGTVTAVDAIAGETISTTPVITLYADQAYELIARVPEVDISSIAIGQTAVVTFDTNSATPLVATVTYIAPTNTTIDGVAYYEARLQLAESPAWLRNGLNADIDIVVSEVVDQLRVPTRFISNLTDNPTVQVLTNGILATTTISVKLIGNDGFVAVTGVSVGDVIVAP